MSNRCYTPQRAFSTPLLLWWSFLPSAWSASSWLMVVPSRCPWATPCILGALMNLGWHELQSPGMACAHFSMLRAGGGLCTQQPGSPACSAARRWCRHIPPLRKGFRSPAVSQCSPLPACPAHSESYSFSTPCDPCKSQCNLDAPKFGSVLYPATWIVSALRVPAVATHCSISLAVNGIVRLLLCEVLPCAGALWFLMVCWPWRENSIRKCKTLNVARRQSVVRQLLWLVRAPE